ncbi:MAG: hypothetical protein O9284_06320 [Steroidobacteraceae bacterium]|jgi:hypothetical protein|nr:hypothetical protein [Steroidobacteraceae bacterium]
MIDRRRFLGAGLAAVVLPLAAPSLAAARPRRGRPFTFVAMGCMPYGEGDLAKLDRLFAATARERPAFAFHLGDMKASRDPCDDGVYETIRDRFARAPFPLVYTPGDNDWTDCNRVGRDPHERLAFLRRTFYAEPGRSFGRRGLRVTPQSSATGGGFPENVRFEHGGLVFATLHVVGSNNNRVPAEPARVAEFEARDAANLAWLDAAFDHAVRIEAPALVLAWQADPFKEEVKDAPSGFAALLQRLRDRAAAFARPVLVVHADRHTLLLRRWREVVDRDERDVPFLNFLQVMGSEDVHAVRVDVYPRDPAVFGFRPLVVPDNGPY